MRQIQRRWRVGSRRLSPLMLTILVQPHVTDETEDYTYTFMLDKTARDADGDGVVDYKDFTVRVNNSVLKNDGSSSEPGYFTVEPANDNGLGVDEVVIRLKVPDVRDESVQITYEYSRVRASTALLRL